MLRPDVTKWGETLEDLRKLSVSAQHSRSRERFQALYQIGSGQTNATQWAKQIGREDQTVMGWVHLYNAEGTDALLYRHTGGRTPFLAKQSKHPSPRA